MSGSVTSSNGPLRPGCPGGPGATLPAATRMPITLRTKPVYCRRVASSWMACKRDACQRPGGQLSAAASLISLQRPPPTHPDIVTHRREHTPQKVHDLGARHDGADWRRAGAVQELRSRRRLLCGRSRDSKASRVRQDACICDTQIDQLLTVRTRGSSDSRVKTSSRRSRRSSCSTS